MLISAMRLSDAYRKVAKSLLFSLFFLYLATGFALAAGTLKMRIVLVNPSTTKTQTKSVKNYLPKEITLKNILDNGGLEVDYDQEQGLFYVFKNDIELAPSETKSFEIILEDVWVVPEERIEAYRTQTGNVLERLKDTPYFNQADLIVKSILERLGN